MKALQSDLMRRMLDAGIDVTKHLLTGESILFEGKVYKLINMKLPRTR